MRIALVGTFPLHPINFKGGVETSTLNLIEGLVALGEKDIHVVTQNSALCKYVFVDQDFVKYHYLPSNERFNTISLYIRSWIRIQKKLSEIDPDIVHAQNSQSYGYVCLKTKFPVVLSIHGIIQEETRYISGFKNRFRSLFQTKMIQNYCVKNAPHVIQPTRYPEHYFKHLKTGKWHDTGNAIAAKFFEANGEEQEGRVFYSGAIIRRKRLLDLVKALKEVKKEYPNVSLRVAGPTPERIYLKEVTDWIITHKLRKHVKFLGLLSQTELLEEYKKCSMLVLPSGQETSPMVIAEVMALGKPVVATKVGGVAFLVDDGKTGFVVKVGDISELADRITTILSDKKIRGRMAKFAKEKANSNFRREVVASKVLQVYHEVIESHKAS